MSNTRDFLGICGASLGLLVGCGSRPGEWDAAFSAGEVVGLRGSVAVVDSGLDDVLFLSSSAKGRLEVDRFEAGQNVRKVQAALDGTRLFVLSDGALPRVRPEDEAPALRIFSGGTQPKLERTLELDDPMGALSLDPEGEWAVAFAGNSAVSNPNEFVFLDLKDKKSKPRSKTLRSFGGAPRGLVFTNLLTVPEGESRRFVVVPTDRDLALLDLSDLNRSEVTIRLPKDKNGVPYPPEQIVYDDGDPDDPTDARLAVRLGGSSDVVVCQFGPPTEDGKDFSLRVNIVDVGGVPSAVDFVRTDAGLRLASLVPSKSMATLVDPATTTTETVELGAPFTQMSRITTAVSSPPAGGDVALLWGGTTKRIAFWSLGSTSGTPYRSVDSTDLTISLTQVVDVPSPNGHLKLLLGNNEARFFVLDLEERQSFPLQTAGAGYQLSVARDGGRVWAAPLLGTSASMIELEDLHPTTIPLAHNITSVFDIERQGGGRSAVLLHASSGLDVTVLDAENPSASESHYFPALHLRGLE